MGIFPKRPPSSSPVSQKALLIFFALGLLQILPRCISHIDVISACM